MNTLAIMKSQSAVNEYIAWAAMSDINIKASAYNALAQSGNQLAYSSSVKSIKRYTLQMGGYRSNCLILKLCESDWSEWRFKAVGQNLQTHHFQMR
jgi:stress response protein SCP2